MGEAVWAQYGGDPVPLDPEVVRGVLVVLDGTAEAAGGIRGTLVGVSDGAGSGVWVGESAEAFRQKLGELPDLVTKVERSYRDAAAAVRAFVEAAARARADAQALEGAAWSASEQQRSAGSADGATPQGAAQIEAASRARQDVQDEVDRLREDYRQAETRLVGALAQAAEAGIPPESAWHKFLRGVEELAGVIALVLVVIVVVALVVLVVVFTAGAGLGLFAALLLALETLGPLLTALTVASAVKLGATATRKAQYGDADTPSWTSIGIDAALVVVPMGLGKGAMLLRTARGEAVTLANGSRLNKLFPKQEAAFDRWMDGLPTAPLKAKGNAAAYQLRIYGNDERLVLGSPRTWADGRSTPFGAVGDTKYVGNGKSFYDPASLGNEKLAQLAIKDMDKRLLKYAEVIKDPSNPARAVEIVTNTERSAAFVMSRMKALKIPGFVRVVP